jgi:hypothetical protein
MPPRWSMRIASEAQIWRLCTEATTRTMSGQCRSTRDRSILPRAGVVKLLGNERDEVSLGARGGP